MHKRAFSAYTFCSIVSSAMLAGSGCSEAGAGLEVAAHHGELRLPNGFELNELTVRLLGGGYDVSQVLDTRGDQVDLSLSFADVPEADAYRAQLTADGCTGESAEFAVRAGQAGIQEVTLVCLGAPAALVRIKVYGGAADDTCNAIGQLSVYPPTQVTGIGASSQLTLTTHGAVDTSTVSWTALEGLSNTGPDGATFACTRPGEVEIPVQVALAAADGGPGCTEATSVKVLCLAGPACGDGVIAPNEACEPGTSAPQPCSQFDSSFAAGMASCNEGCGWDTSQCSRCGNGQLDLGEVCDPAWIAQIPCSEVAASYETGSATCDASCTWSTSECVDRTTLINGFFSGLPAWDAEHAQPVSADVMTDMPATTETSPLDDPSAQSGKSRYSCTVTPYSLTTTPDKIVTFAPDTGAFWVGALLQGQGYINGLGSLSELPIRERAPIRIWIDLLGNGIVEEVAQPDGASVNQAVANLALRAQQAGTPTGAIVSYTKESANSAEEFFLRAGFSVKYMSVSTKGSLEVTRNAKERTVMAYFIQRAFTATVVTPQTPAAWFTDEFSYDDLLEQQRQGRLGPGNLPVYVSNIAYGRLMALSITAEASDEEIKAAVDFAYSGGADIKLESQLRSKEILSRSQLKVVTVGGDDSAVRQLVVDARLGDYFAQPADVTTMRPISFQIVDVAGNRTAKFGETTNYNLQQCVRQDNRLVAIGDRVSLKLTRAQVAARTADGRTNPCANWPGTGADLYGELRINGQLLWSRARNNFITVQPESYLELDPDIELPNTNPELPGIPFLYAQGGSILISGEINDHQGLDGDPSNRYDTRVNFPFAYDTPLRLPATSVYCPVSLEYQVTKLADIQEWQP